MQSTFSKQNDNSGRALCVGQLLANPIPVNVGTENGNGWYRSCRRQRRLCRRRRHRRRQCCVCLSYSWTQRVSVMFWLLF